MRSGGAGAVEAVRLALEAAAERLFKSISRAHALLTDAAERRRFDTLELHHDCYHVGSKVLPHAPPHRATCLVSSVDAPLLSPATRQSDRSTDGERWSGVHRRGRSTVPAGRVSDSSSRRRGRSTRSTRAARGGTRTRTRTRRRLASLLSTSRRTRRMRRGSTARRQRTGSGSSRSRATARSLARRPTLRPAPPEEAVAAAAIGEGTLRTSS